MQMVLLYQPEAVGRDSYSLPRRYLLITGEPLDSKEQTKSDAGQSEPKTGEQADTQAEAAQPTSGKFLD